VKSRKADELKKKHTVIGEPVDVNAFKGVAKRQLSV